MPRPWFTLTSCDAEFLASAPQRQVGVFEISQPGAQVWDALTADGTLSWCRALSGVTWTSPRPFGERTTRTVRTPLGMMLLREVYFRWEEGRRKSFYVSQATLPLFRRFAEDYLVEETSPSSCRFTWTVASEAPPAARPGAPINAAITRSLFADTRRHFNASSGARTGRAEHGPFHSPPSISAARPSYRQTAPGLWRPLELSSGHQR